MGSEMCIRDRSPLGPRQRTINLKRIILILFVITDQLPHHRSRHVQVARGNAAAVPFNARECFKREQAVSAVVAGDVVGVGAIE